MCKKPRKLRFRVFAHYARVFALVRGGADLPLELPLEYLLANMMRGCERGRGLLPLVHASDVERVQLSEAQLRLLPITIWKYQYQIFLT